MWPREWLLKPAVVIAAVIAALVPYLVMLLYTVPRLAAGAGGMAMFDMRPRGYTHAEAIAYLRALTPSAREFYLTTQHGIDTPFPVLLALATGLAIAYLTRPGEPGMVAPPAGLRKLLIFVVCPLMAMLALAENHAVAAMLRLEPARVSESMVAAASMLTVAKSLMVTVGLTSLVVIGGMVAIRRWRSRD
jgi:hypothetical protein